MSESAVPANEKLNWFRRWIFPPADSGGTGIWVRRLLFYIVVLYVSLALLIFLFQRKLIYHPSRTGRLLANESGRPVDSVHDVEIETHDGLTLHGWHFLAHNDAAGSQPARDKHLREAKWVVLYFHGNAGDRAMRKDDCEPLTDAGADVLHFDYRGYGDNPGSPNESDIIADAKTLWRYAVQTRGVKPERIVIFGESLGGGVAVRLAAEMCQAGTPPGGLILTGTFSSLVDAASYHYRWLPVRWMLRDRYESVKHAPAITCPVLQIHGKQDRIVPIRLAERLHAAFPRETETKWVEHPAGHNSLSTHLLRREVAAFLGR